MANFNCAIVTPSEQILDDEVVEVEFPQWDGQRGILTGAAPFVGRLGTGRLRIRYEQGAEKNFLLAGGFDKIDYAEVRDPVSLAPVGDPVNHPARLFVAARIGGTRLIDNMAISPL